MMNKRALIISVLWLILGVVIFYALMMLVLSFNLFSWHFKLDMPIYVLIFVVLLSMVCCFILAKYTTEKIEIWFSFLISIGLMLCGLVVLYYFYTETASSGFLSRSTLSPHWFRVSIFAVYMTALISWLAYPYKYLKKLKLLRISQN